MSSLEDREKREQRLRRNRIAKELKLDRKYRQRVITEQRTPKTKVNISTFRNLSIEDLEE